MFGRSSWDATSFEQRAEQAKLRKARRLAGKPAKVRTVVFNGAALDAIVAIEHRESATEIPRQIEVIDVNQIEALISYG